MRACTTGVTAEKQIPTKMKMEIGWIGKARVWFCERLMVAKVVRLYHKYV